jgi:tetratricopeptide (TPR) repeat protein
MKKTLLSVFIAGVIGSTAYAQPAKVLSAYESFDAYKREKATGNIPFAIQNLLDAKKFLDEAILNEKTSGKSKTWARRAEVYVAIALEETPDLKSMQNEAIKEAYESVKKAMTVEPKVFEEKKLPVYLAQIANLVFNRGFEAFERKDYIKALEDFGMSTEIKMKLGVVDTVGMVNMFLAAYNGKQSEAALSLGEGLVKMGAADPFVYRTMSAIYLENGDTTKGIQVIKDARKAFPSKPEFITEELNFYLMTGDNEKASATLQEAIDAFKDDKNLLKVLHFNAGVIYGQMKDEKKAFESYKKALELDENYYEALNNIGSYILDEANKFLLEARNLPLNQTKKYDELMKKGKDKFAEAAIYLERAYKVKPSESLKKVLIELYGKSGQDAKIKDLN